MIKQINALKQAVELSISGKNCRELNAKFKIQVKNKNWNCYAVSIAHRDVLCFCDQGAATFLVDSYSDRNVAELFDWDEA